MLLLSNTYRCSTQLITTAIITCRKGSGGVYIRKNEGTTHSRNVKQLVIVSLHVVKCT